MHHFFRVAKPGGYLVLSGLLQDQAGLVRPSLEKHGFVRETTLSQEE